VQEPTSNAQPELDVRALHERLIPILRDLGIPKVNGARLAPLIDTVLPTGTGYRLYVPEAKSAALQSFVKKYLQDVVVPSSERSGTDPLYDIIHVTTAVASEIRTDGQLWRTFVAVSPIKQMYFDRNTAELNLREPIAGESPDIAIINSVNIDEHTSICWKFYDSLEAEGVEAPMLKALLEKYEPTLYPVWLKTLRLSKPRLDQKWGEFREAAILQLFKQRLISANVDQTRAEELAIQLSRDHDQLRKDKGALTAQVPAAIALNAPVHPPKDTKEKQARDLLHAVIDRMSYEQMQSVPIPFGIVLDLVKITVV
jgi:hypothetical protein